MLTSSAGRFKDVNIIIIIASPAWGIPAPPKQDAVTVMLKKKKKKN